MISNPTVHTRIPRRSSFQNRILGRKRKNSVFAIDRQLWLGIAKISSISLLFLLVVSMWLGSSMAQVSVDIDKVKSVNAKLANENIMLRVEKAQLFSPKAVDVLAGSRLAVHLPDPGQYRKL